MKLKRADFAKLSNTSRSAITQAGSSGRLVIGPDGTIDTEDPVNEAFLMLHASDGQSAGAEKAVSPKKSPPAVDRGHGKGTVSGSTRGETRQTGRAQADSGDAPLSVQLLRAQVLERHARVDGARLKQAQTLKLLVETEMVQKMLAKIGVAVRSNLVELPERLAARAVAAARSTEDPELAVRELLRDEIARAMTRVLEEVECANL